MVLDRGAAVEDLAALARQPVAEVAHAPERRALTQLVGADRDGIEKLLDFGKPAGGGQDRAHAMPGEPVGL